MVTFAVPDKITAEEIRTIRRKLGLTRAEFARLANVSKKTVEGDRRADRRTGEASLGISADERGIDGSG